MSGVNYSLVRLRTLLKDVSNLFIALIGYYVGSIALSLVLGLAIMVGDALVIALSIYGLAFGAFLTLLELLTMKRKIHNYLKELEEVTEK